jgi:hypothetical protein
MFMSKLKGVMAVLLVLSVIGLGAGAGSYRLLAKEKDEAKTIDGKQPVGPATIESTMTVRNPPMNQTAQASSAPVDTAKVANRRSLRFESIDHVLAEVDRLAESRRAGRLKRLGNWTLGQALGHLATWA